MNSWIRVIISVLSVGIVYFTIKKTKNRVIRVTVLLIVEIMLINMSYFPIVNIFNVFTTPEDAFRHNHYQSITATINGENSALVFYSEGTSDYNSQYIIKKGDFYKAAAPFQNNSTTVFPVTTYVNENMYCAYFIDKCNNDFYINIAQQKVKNFEDIRDSLSSEFYEFDDSDGRIKRYYIVLDELPEHYTLYIGDETVTVF